MQTFVSNQVGRTFILKLEQGEDLIEGIESLIATHHVANAVILTGIATLDRTSLNVVQGTDYPINFITDHQQTACEVVAIDGFICDGDVHLHGVLADTTHTYAGHLNRGCRILYLAEVVIQELLDLNIERRPNAHGVSQIFEKA